MTSVIPPDDNRHFLGGLPEEITACSQYLTSRTSVIQEDTLARPSQQRGSTTASTLPPSCAIFLSSARYACFLAIFRAVSASPLRPMSLLCPASFYWPAGFLLAEGLLFCSTSRSASSATATLCSTCTPGAETRRCSTSAAAVAFCSWERPNASPRLTAKATPPASTSGRTSTWADNSAQATQHNLDA